MENTDREEILRGICREWEQQMMNTAAELVAVAHQMMQAAEQIHNSVAMYNRDPQASLPQAKETVMDGRDPRDALTELHRALRKMREILTFVGWQCNEAWGFTVKEKD